MKMIGWKAWYRGGRVFCSTGVDPSELPDDEMLGVMVAFDKKTPDGAQHYCRQLSGTDLYWYVEIEGEPTWCHGAHEDRPEKRYPGAVIIRGIWTTDEEMQRVNAKMAEWRG